jgi:hypothetical protein
MRVQQDYDGSWSVWDGATLLVGGLKSHADAWAEVDRRTTRANWKSGSCEYRDLGSFDHGKHTPWTNPKRSRWGSRKKMHRRAPKIIKGKRSS